MPVSENKKVIEWWKKGYYLESTPAADPGVWSNVSSDPEPDWDFDGLIYRIKCQQTGGLVNIYSSVSGNADGCTQHRVSGPFWTLEEADAEAAATKTPRTARVWLGWLNGAEDVGD